jgi:3-polyprenyl-4-hydroxybenzoate decarboxylase
MAASDLVFAMTGASGVPYGIRLLEVLLRAGRTLHLTISPAANDFLDRIALAVLINEPQRRTLAMGRNALMFASLPEFWKLVQFEKSQSSTSRAFLQKSLVCSSCTLAGSRRHSFAAALDSTSVKM